MRKIEIFCENTQRYYHFPLGISLKEIEHLIKPNLNGEVLAALVNRELKDLSYQIINPKRIEFVDVTSLDGISVYIRSLCFVLYKAILKLYPGTILRIEHFISNGLFCRLEDRNIIITEEDIEIIRQYMQEIIEEDLPFTRDTMETDIAIKLFEEKGLAEKKELLETRKQLYTSVYRLNDDIDYFYGVLAYSTGVLKNFDLLHFHQGMLLMYPDRENPEELLPFIPQEKMFKILSEFKRWGKILEISDIGDLNRHVENNEIGELIKVSEALHEKKIAQIADRINKRRKITRVVFIAGPSSSGKTTFSKRLAIQLKVVGLKPITISLDNYFVDRDKTPKDINGDYNFESIEALDVEKFNEDMLALMDGKEVEIPKFSFDTGKRFYNGEKTQIGRKNIIIIEGIHGLNPLLSKMIPDKVKFKIFVSAMTSISIDGHNVISSTDNRLIRRMVRDYRYRGYSAIETLQRWESVLKGENENIFPFQEEADIMFNSALPYELGVLKFYAEPILKEVLPIHPEHSKSERLLKFFSYFLNISGKGIPPTSILREFLGGSTFKY